MGWKPTYMLLLTADRQVIKMKLLMRWTPPCQPAFWMATVMGERRARDWPLIRPSALAGHVRPKKMAEPM